MMSHFASLSPRLGAGLLGATSILPPGVSERIAANRMFRVVTLSASDLERGIPGGFHFLSRGNFTTVSETVPPGLR